jgi:putative peptidoglycan lipid II flippase
VNSILATSQGPGAVSWLNYAFRLMQFPIGVFGVSLAAATLPRVSALWVEKNPQGVAETLTRSLRHVFAINLPASAGLAFLGAPVIALLFQYGRFGVVDTEATATALAAYAAGLTAYSAVKVLVPACYALGNTRLPVISSVLSVGLTVALNLVMVRPFGYWGLALGTSLAACFNAVFLLVSIRKILAEHGGRFSLGPVVRGFLAYSCLAVVMGLSVRASYGLLDSWMPDSWLQGAGFGLKVGTLLARLIKVALAVVEGGVLTLLLGRMAGLSEISEVAEIFNKKLKKKLSRS